MTKKKATSKLTFQGIGQPKKTGSYTPPTPILGCTNPNAINYDSSANTDDGSCILPVYGCTIQTDPVTGIDNQNYDPNANVNQVSATDTSNPCIPHVIGCMDPNYLEYDASHTQDTTPTACVTPIVYGCTDPNATNYDASANVDDGSCFIGGCTDSNAFNYDPTATVDDGSCTYYACDDPNAQNYNPNASPTGPVYFTDNSLCAYTPISGCTDPAYLEYDPLATIDDGTCSTLIVNGCMNPLAFNYNSSANNDDGSCIISLPPNNTPQAYLTTDTDIDPNWLPSSFTNASQLIFGININTGLYPPSKADVSLSQTNTGWVWNNTFDPLPSSGTIAHTGTGGYGIIDFTDVNGVSLGDGDVSGTITYTWLALDGSGTVLHTVTENVGTYDSVNNVYTPNIPLTIIMGCMWPGAQNTQTYPTVNFHTSIMCIPHSFGCTDPNAINYYPGATMDDGSCVYAGCTDPTATNYVGTVTHSVTGDTYNITVDDGSCVLPLGSGQHTNLSFAGIFFPSGNRSGLIHGTGTVTVPNNINSAPNGGYYQPLMHPSFINLFSAALVPGTGVHDEPYTYEVDFYVGCGTTNPCIDPNDATSLMPGVTFADEATAGLTADLGNNFWYPGPPLGTYNLFGQPGQATKAGWEDFLNLGDNRSFFNYNGYGNQNIYSMSQFPTPSQFNLTYNQVPPGSPVDPSGETPVEMHSAGYNIALAMMTMARSSLDIPGNTSGAPGYWAIRFRARNASGQLAQTDLVVQWEVPPTSIFNFNIYNPPIQTTMAILTNP